MGTISYFEETVVDATGRAEAALEFGTTGYAGNGPQLFIKWDEKSIILSHDDAKKLCDAVERISLYFGYDKS